MVPRAVFLSMSTIPKSLIRPSLLGHSSKNPHNSWCCPIADARTGHLNPVESWSLYLF